MNLFLYHHPVHLAMHGRPDRKACVGWTRKNTRVTHSSPNYLVLSLPSSPLLSSCTSLYSSIPCQPMRKCCICACVVHFCASPDCSACADRRWCVAQSVCGSVFLVCGCHSQLCVEGKFHPQHLSLHAISRGMLSASQALCCDIIL